MLTFVNGFGQQLHITQATKQVLQEHCYICILSPEDTAVVIKKYNHSVSNIDFHNCHVYFFNKNIDSAYKFALSARVFFAEVHDTVGYDYATYIKFRLFITKMLYKEALKIGLSLKDKRSIPEILRGDICFAVGNIYLVQHSYDASLEKLLFYKNNFNIKDQLLYKSLYNNIAINYLLLKDVKKAEYYFHKCIAITRLIKDTAGECSAYTNIANYYYNNYQDALAEKYFKKAYLLSLGTNDYKLKLETSLNMSVVAENKKDFRSALTFRKQYEDFNDSLNDRDNIWNFAQEKNKLEAALNTQKIELAQQTNRVQALELGRRKEQFYIALIAAFSFFSFLLLALFAYRQKTKQNKIISAQREALNSLNDTKDQLFSVVAHDLRSPVQTLRITLMKLRKALLDKSITNAETVAMEIEVLSNSVYSLLNNLLYWSLSQTGQLHFNSQELAVRRLVEQVTYDYEPVAAAKNIILKNCVSDLLYCAGDVHTIKIILRNLIDNAIKFSEPDTAIIIAATEDKEYCKISISDNGKGIDAEVVNALQDKQARRVHTRLGTGIGLWLAKTMAEKNGGTLLIEKLIKGTRMIINLPKHQGI